MVGCHHRLNGHAFEQTLGNTEGQGSLAGSQRVGHDSATEQQQFAGEVMGLDAMILIF